MATLTAIPTLKLRGRWKPCAKSRRLKPRTLSTGSGSPMAYGLIENVYKKDGTVKENLPVAAKAISVAMRRDCATGESVDVVTITKSGFKRLEKSEVEKLLQ